MLVLLFVVLILATSLSAASGLLLPGLPGRGVRLPSLPSKSAKEGQRLATVQEQNNQVPNSITFTLPPFDPVSTVALLTLVFMAWKLAELGGVQVDQGKVLVEQGKVLAELSTSVKLLDAKFSQVGSHITLFGTIFTIVPISIAIAMALNNRFKQGDTIGKTGV